MSNKELVSHLSTAVETVGLLIALQWPSGGGSPSGQPFPLIGLLHIQLLSYSGFICCPDPAVCELPSPYSKTEQLNCEGLWLGVGGSRSRAQPLAEPAGSISAAANRRSCACAQRDCNVPAETAEGSGSLS